MLRGPYWLLRRSKWAFSRSLMSTYSGNAKGLSCDVEAEPLARYHPGGYHPVHLGDLLGNRRYRIIHKLGFGGYSTIWAARDEITNRNVALKIEVSETFSTSKESEVLGLCSQSPNEPGPECVPRLLHAFRHHGPNGSHHCLVMDILGSSVPAVLEDRFDSERLPREIATTAIRELLCGISYLHRQGLAHGDIHVGNLCFSAPSLASTTEEELLRVLGRPTISKVHGRLGQSHNQGIPEYLVRPSPVPVTDTPTKNIRIIDFGQSFTNSTRPRTLKTPLVLRPPEVLFNDDWDYRVDLWSTGCTIFELMTGQPPFDSVMATKETLIVQMIESIGQLPPMWQDKLPPNQNPQNDGSSIQEWLRELIFDSDLPPNYTGEEVEDVGSLIGQLMRFNPYERISAEEACRKWSTYFPP